MFGGTGGIPSQRKSKLSLSPGVSFKEVPTIEEEEEGSESSPMSRLRTLPSPNIMERVPVEIMERERLPWKRNEEDNKEEEEEEESKSRIHNINMQGSLMLEREAPRPAKIRSFISPNLALMKIEGRKVVNGG